MARNFKELEAKISPARRAKIQRAAHDLLSEMLLSEIRRHAGVTQQKLAKSLGVRQPTLSRLESQDDMQISTLQRIVKALGGRLEIIAKLPDGEVRLSQFDSATV